MVVMLLLEFSYVQKTAFDVQIQEFPHLAGHYNFLESNNEYKNIVPLP